MIAAAFERAPRNAGHSHRPRLRRFRYWAKPYLDDHRIACASVHGDWCGQCAIERLPRRRAASAIRYADRALRLVVPECRSNAPRLQLRSLILAPAQVGGKLPLDRQVRHDVHNVTVSHSVIPTRFMNARSAVASAGISSWTIDAIRSCPSSVICCRQL